ncbi:hypothetical protein EIN_090250 [Entamoeba invadens IP1]|uniref:Nucleotide-diphospho-sugar transferase domain-containing protein n=1 Tax=Entamoeba invadens IP1 TaxID=370355 RepID=A0A0A1TVG3_ENTIV|nr:hypothetical protein EIN_090250 [Entamoeba invadens IP1]ELP84392.1 hypothetical protein EIN_090250 [Entamoeba invadens IP1]|eukprot:XP_004183738.1 hypothetical protein EIN_090250 [Entamoeba invadens IP1]
MTNPLFIVFSIIQVFVFLCISLLLLSSVNSFEYTKNYSQYIPTKNSVQLNDPPLNNITFIQPTYYNDKINVLKFNYNGPCKETFKYRAHNKRDLFISAVGFTNDGYWLQNKHDILLSYGLVNSSIPNATLIMLIMPGTTNKDFINETRNFGFEVVEGDLSNVKNVEKCHPATQRFIAFKNYIEKYREQYDRVLIADHRDVFVFADIFQTFSAEDLVFMPECGLNNQTCVYFDEKHVYQWMNESYGSLITEQFKANGSINMNVGVTFGGTERVLRYLNILVDNFNPKKWHLWGHDQSVLNSIFYSLYYKRENYTFERCTQRSCFFDESIQYDKKNKILIDPLTKCSPVLRHKVNFIPNKTHIVYNEVVSIFLDHNN